MGFRFGSAKAQLGVIERTCRFRDGCFGMRINTNRKLYARASALPAIAAALVLSSTPLSAQEAQPVTTEPPPAATAEPAPAPESNSGDDPDYNYDDGRTVAGGLAPVARGARPGRSPAEKTTRTATAKPLQPTARAVTPAPGRSTIAPAAPVAAPAVPAVPAKSNLRLRRWIERELAASRGADHRGGVCR